MRNNVSIGLNKNVCKSKFILFFWVIKMLINIFWNVEAAIFGLKIKLYFLKHSDQYLWTFFVNLNESYKQNCLSGRVEIKTKIFKTSLCKCVI